MNWYFLIVSTFILVIVGTFTTEKYLAPRFENSDFTVADSTVNSEITPLEKKGMKLASIGLLICVIILVALCIGPNAFMKDVETGSILAASSPLWLVWFQSLL